MESYEKGENIGKLMQVVALHLGKERGFAALVALGAQAEITRLGEFKDQVAKGLQAGGEGSPSNGRA